jgi:caffeoyl-CoA O-methyltransferase
MQLVDPDIESYAEEHTTSESGIIKKLIERSEQELDHTDMLSGRVVGRLLAMLVKISGARRVLEVGMFTGYSALCMAEALPEDGTLITCELNEHYKAIAQSAFEESDHGHKISMEMGPALETIAGFNQTFDFIFLDADKVNYANYYKAVLPLLNAGGLLVIDNVLWSGEVLEPTDEKAQAIEKFNKMISRDERMEQVILTVRDGVTIARKK